MVFQNLKSGKKLKLNLLEVVIFILTTIVKDPICLYVCSGV